MGKLTKDTVRKLLLLNFIGNFRMGVFGNFKLQKVMYDALKKSKVKPFPFRRTSDGQFSQEVWDALDELYKTGLIYDARNDPDRRIWRINNHFPYSEYNKAFNDIFEELAQNIKNSIEEHGYKKWQQIKDEFHSDPALKNTPLNEIIFEDNIPEIIEVELSDDDCEDLELSLTSGFVNTMTELILGIESGEIELEQWPIEA